MQKAGDDDMMTFQMENPSKPGIFKMLGNKVDFLYLVMPVRMGY